MDAGSVRMPWGKHKGRRLLDVPSAYLVWLVEEGDPPPWLRFEIRRLLHNRFSLTERVPPAQPDCSRCGRVRDRWPAVYSRLALAVHPDRGGSTEAMQLVVEADEFLR
jgi:hypothetical protein